MGVCILISAYSKLQYVLQLSKYTNEKNRGMLLAAIVTFILGIVLIFNPFRAAKWMIRLVGICIAFTGASDLITGIYFSQDERLYKRYGSIRTGLCRKINLRSCIFRQH